MEPIIATKKLSKSYTNVLAVDNLDLSIYQGEVFGLLGPNGAGKSTTILMLMGLCEPSKGVAEVCGYNANTEPLEVKKKVGFLPDNVGFYDHRSGLDNLEFIGKLNGITQKEVRNKAYQLLEKVGLQNDAHRKVGAYSKGMKQRLGLAEVLIKDPQVIILDEPTIGIDPSGVKDFLELIVSLSRHDRITVLFSSHQLHQVQRVCDRVGIFVKGKLLACGDLQTLSKNLFQTDAFASEFQLETSVEDISTFKMKLKERFPDISRVEEQERNIWVVNSKKDIRAELCDFLVSKKHNILLLREKHYGLDEIYQQYFEGGSL